MPIKKARLRHVIHRMLGEECWDRKELSQVLGLAESVRGDVKRRWRLGPLYKVLHGGGHITSTVPSERSKACLQKVVDTLDERRSLLWRPTAWEIPKHPNQQYIPNTDAAGQGGYGGCLWIDDKMFYFSGEWSTELKEARVNIAVLEAWAVVMAATTWGKHLHGKKVVFRSDSSPACFCLNKLSSDLEEMNLVVNAWEDVQFYYGFEGLLVHCPGVDNVLADMASRADQNGMEESLQNEMDNQEMDGVQLVRCEVVWRVHNINIDYEQQLLHYTEQRANLRR